MASDLLQKALPPYILASLSRDGPAEVFRAELSPHKPPAVFSRSGNKKPLRRNNQLGCVMVKSTEVTLSAETTLAHSSTKSAMTSLNLRQNTAPLEGHKQAGSRPGSPDQGTTRRRDSHAAACAR